MLGLLLKHFEKQSFKEWQLKIIQGVLEKRDTLVVQPTGSGKSLCFQFPGVVTGKITVVLVPTISLMVNEASVDPRACILKFEKEALAYDEKMRKETKGQYYH